MRRFILVLGLLAFCAGLRVSAVPLLQLDIAGGTYDSSPDAENIVSTSNPFTVQALFNTLSGTASGTYYLAVAIVPKTENPPLLDFGSFKIGDVTYSVDNMHYGTPPLAFGKSGDLASHGIYDTHYFEIGFMFDDENRANLYNSQDDPGGLVENEDGEILFHEFEVDVSGLSAGYQVHFDLYNLNTGKRGKPGVKDFAPFSHDAQSAPPSVADTSSTMILLGMAMLAIEGLRRRFVR